VLLFSFKINYFGKLFIQAQIKLCVHNSEHICGRIILHSVTDINVSSGICKMNIATNVYNHERMHSSYPYRYYHNSKNIIHIKILSIL